jgi:hypothetical protein
MKTSQPSTTKQYWVEFVNVSGKVVKMKLTLSPEIAKMNNHPKKEVKK